VELARKGRSFTAAGVDGERDILVGIVGADQKAATVVRVHVAALLDDPAFFEPFRPFFHPVAGRPSTPIETYLRLMFLKYRYKLGFEALCREVADSVSWSRFCRIPLGGRVPDASTLKKLTIAAGKRRWLRSTVRYWPRRRRPRCSRSTRLVRGDTTVVPADVAYPTDSGLMARGVARLVALVAVLHGLGLASRTTMRDRGRSLRRRAHDIGAWLRRRSEEAKEEAKAITGEMASIAEMSLADARHVATNARRGIAKAGDLATGKPGRHWRSWKYRSPAWSGWWPRPSCASPAPCPRARPAWSACTTPTRGPSPRAAWDARSSSATWPRCSTTPTAWCSTMR
jgi:IS5 family transposase